MTERYVHNTTGLEILAWRYDPAAGIPVWVARRWHDLGDGEGLTAVDVDKQMFTARPGDYILQAVLDPAGNYPICLTADELAENFTRPSPAAP